MKHAAHAVFEHAIASYPVFQIAVNPKLATLPPSFADAPAVTLNIEPGNKSNNNGFRLAENGFTTTMSFDRAPFVVVIPWAAFMVMATPACLVQFAVAEEKPKLTLVKG